MSELRVLVATSIYPTDERPGRGSYVKTQVEALREIGLAVDVFVLPSKGRSRVRGTQYVNGARELSRQLRQGYDLVHAHYSFMGMIARMQRRLPLVVTYHGSDLLGAVNNGDGRHTRFGEVAVRIGRLLGRVVDASIVQTDEMATRLGARDHVHVIPHEVDLDLFRPIPRDEARREVGLDTDSRYVLFAADPRVQVKRFGLARAAVDRLNADGLDAELVVCSREPQARLALYMNACDALVLSSFQEGSPNVVKQSMACNLPIVSTDVGDVRELVGTTDGCYVCAAEPDALAAPLRELLVEPRRTSGREAVKHLAKSRVAAQVEAVYHDVLTRTRPARATESRERVA